MTSFLPEVVRGYHTAQNVQSPASQTAPPPAQDLENPLARYFAEHHSGPGIWKWTHYFEVYHRHLQKFVGKPLRVLEIGVFSGGSLRMWRDYFGDGCHIIGVDIEAASETYANEYTEIFIGDQADREFWRDVCGRIAPVDVIIDDGGHTSEQQIVTLEALLPHLNAGGVYICEDVHNPHSGFSCFMHGLHANMSAYHKTANDPLTVQPNSTQALLHSIHTYPFMTVIEKTQQPRTELVALKKGTEWQPPYQKAKE